MKHQCAECKVSYSNLSNLRKHVRKFHPKDVLQLAPLRYKKNSPESNIKCKICGKTFNHRQSLTKHSKIHFSEEEQLSKCNLKNSKKCPLCGFSNSFRKVLREHFQNVHKIKMCWKTFTFSSINKFNQWKNEIENKTTSKFINKRTTTWPTYKKIEFICHRSGDYIPTGKGLRNLKKQGSSKINAYCPANIEVIVKTDEPIKVKYLDSHVGHEPELGHLQLTKEERDSIAEKIAANIPFDTILDEIRDSIHDNDLKRIHLLTKKDLFNIQSSYNLCSSSSSSSSFQDPINNAISIESWIFEIHRFEECILFYKSQGQILQEEPQLKKEDFILIIMTPAQGEILKKFGSNFICIDKSYELNNNYFELHTLFVIDDLKEGFPCAFLISNRCDIDIINLFLTQISKQIGIITTKTLMTDLNEIYFNAWLQVMGIPENRLYCTWDVDRVWRKSLSKINNHEKKVLTYKEIRTLLEESDPVAFEEMFENWCNNTSDPEVIDFKNYFKEKYRENSEYWAYCYRLHSNLKNISKHLERMHRTIKYIYLEGKNVKQLDKRISALMRFVRDKFIDRLIVLNKGKLSAILKDIYDRHKNLENIDLTAILPTEHGWEISSTYDNEIYFIQEGNDSCQCQLRCEECDICLHRYYCSCQESALKFNMCEHIHQLIKFMKQTANDIEVKELSSDELIMEFEEYEENSEIIILNTEKENEITNEERKELLVQFQTIVSSATSHQELDAIKKALNSLKTNLAAINN